MSGTDKRTGPTDRQANSTPFDRAALRNAAEANQHTGEQWLLGGLLTYVHLFEHVPAGFGKCHFSDELHGRIFEALQAVSSHISKGAVWPQVVHRLGGDREIRRYISELVQGSKCYHPDQIIATTQSITEAYTLRRLLSIADMIYSGAGNGKEPAPPSALATCVMNELDLLLHGTDLTRRAVSIGDAVNEALDRADAIANGEPPPGLSTGFDSLDEILRNLRGGRLTVIAARPGVGKTALGIQIVRNAIRQSMASAAAKGTTAAGALIISNEMQALELGERWICQDAGIDADHLYRGTHHQFADKWVPAQRAFRAMPISIEDAGGLGLADINIALSMAERRHGVGLLLVDHLHITPPDRDDMRTGNVPYAVGKVAEGLKKIAKAHDIPVIALAQMSRAVETREDKEPILPDLRNSGDIEAIADAVIFIHRPEMNLPKTDAERKGAWEITENSRGSSKAMNDLDLEEKRRALKGLANLIVAKNRSGRLGSLPFTFAEKQTKFVEGYPVDGSCY